ncbi:NAD(P)H-binding protein [Candidatus Methanoperedens nitratireducens]|uniref:Putative NAD-dependent epimerase/dehydratase n=1 Tax=Candidatus Methanoperedens nitratireducens TaxID=1392998 RepID=A0A284VSF9_9EURY|nr:NAD(P)H-binding protein [Candidatus Methanoperedens nitroreducens]SNQ62202.1 putative NAD-dependent epimerase/dehydratase [Candidatus Methanoperedens nitroreducens]
MILLTGATGFIGGHVLRALSEKNIPVRCLVRKPIESENPNITYMIGDILNYDSLVKATEGVDTVYYFIHMMGKQREQEKFNVLDRNAITNMVGACKVNGVTRIIYLTGMSNPKEKLSAHLASRKEVEEIIKNSGINYTIFRASVIIGRGAAAFEILDTVVRLFLIIPVLSWSNSKVQPISIGDVVRYLVECLDKKETINRCFDIGGLEVFTYKELMKQYSLEIGIIPFFIWIPGTWHWTSSHILGMLAPVNSELVYRLIESLKNNMVAEPNDLKQIFGFEPVSFKESIRKIIKSD